MVVLIDFTCPAITVATGIVRALDRVRVRGHLACLPPLLYLSLYPTSTTLDSVLRRRASWTGFPPRTIDQLPVTDCTPETEAPSDAPRPGQTRQTDERYI